MAKICDCLATKTFSAFEEKYGRELPERRGDITPYRRDTHRVDAIVRLFGELTYFVVLSDHYDGADFCATLVYDAYRGEENEMLFAHEQAEILQMEDVANSPETVRGDLEGFGRNFCAFLERMMEQKRLKDIAAKKLAAKAVAEPGREGPIN